MRSCLLLDDSRFRRSSSFTEFSRTCMWNTSSNVSCSSLFTIILNFKAAFRVQTSQVPCKITSITKKKASGVIFDCLPAVVTNFPESTKIGDTIKISILELLPTKKGPVAVKCRYVKKWSAVVGRCYCCTGKLLRLCWKLFIPCDQREHHLISWQQAFVLHPLQFHWRIFGRRGNSSQPLNDSLCNSWMLPGTK